MKKQSIKPVFSLFILILIFREDATSALATGFHAGPLSWLNMNLEMLVFVEGGKPKNLKKTLRVRHKTTTNSAHIWHWVGIKSSPHWWEASALTTVPSVLPYAYTLCFQGFHFCFWQEDNLFPKFYEPFYTKKTFLQMVKQGCQNQSHSHSIYLKFPVFHFSAFEQ